MVVRPPRAVDLRRTADGRLAGAPAASGAGSGSGSVRVGIARRHSIHFVAAHPDKADQFASIDANQDGFLDEAERKAHHAAKGEEGGCGAKAGGKKAGEGKCGEGKCGGMA